MGELRLFSFSELHPGWVPEGADVPGAHTQAVEVSICVHSTEQQAGINLARAFIFPVIRAINHNTQNMQEKWQRALKMGDVILPAHCEVEKPVL